MRNIPDERLPAGGFPPAVINPPEATDCRHVMTFG
jgi:hypothetical protein